MGPPGTGVVNSNRIPRHRAGKKREFTGSMFHFLPKVVADKVERLIALLKLSKNTVVYTG